MTKNEIRQNLNKLYSGELARCINVVKDNLNMEQLDIGFIIEDMSPNIYKLKGINESAAALNVDLGRIYPDTNLIKRWMELHETGELDDLQQKLFKGEN